MTPAQCRAARAFLDWSQQTLADAAAVGVVTVRQFESGSSEPRRATLAAIQRALETAGVRFHDPGYLRITVEVKHLLPGWTMSTAANAIRKALIDAKITSKVPTVGIAHLGVDLSPLEGPPIHDDPAVKP